MPDSASPIMPSTKVGALLDEYPELEEVLIGVAPPFKKLKKPMLRKTHQETRKSRKMELSAIQIRFSQ